ncbi:hypothetical protein DID76_04075, partial [Candidatus Marinamargulisbacteria bacterium SCGC AG-414-C22]
MKNIYILMLLVLTSVFVCAEQQSIHVHGEATGAIIIDRSYVQVELSIPAMTVLGFEHQAHTPAEKERVKQAKKLLAKENLFTFYHQKGWFLSDVKNVPMSLSQHVEFTAEKPKDHHDHDHSHHADHHDSEDEHAEFIVKLTMKFSNDTNLNT